ncbi:MAG: hypothetical protein BM564_03065 [Bacteroidetes bacterium MedPE-SWsnd-G2]|nr:MAG: hypothetical protein BM564_03065 [Bacteroidetes bacterium MedPE-SWsnd-G2]
MKTGIIIIFHNREEEIDKDFFKDHISKANDVEICLVNNNSKDNTYQLLKEISEKCKNVSVVNINKFKTGNSAIRAGARYLVNQFNLREIGYIDTSLLLPNHKELNNILKVIIEEHDEILKYKKQVSQQKKIKQSMFQCVFSLQECMMVFKNEHQVVSFQE